MAAPIFDDLQKSVIGAVTILLRRDTLFHSIADVTIGSTGHAMLFTSDGTPVICPILAPEEHTVKPELINVLGHSSPAGRWRRTILTAARIPCSASRRCDSVSHWRPAASAENIGSPWSGRILKKRLRRWPISSGKVLFYGLAVLAVLWGTGVLAAPRIARPIQLLHGGVQENRHRAFGAATRAQDRG